MNKSEISQKIQNYIVKEFGIEAAMLDDGNVNLVEGLGLDSIDIIDILTQVNADFGMDLYPKDLEGCETFNQFVETIHKKYLK